MPTTPPGQHVPPAGARRRGPLTLQPAPDVDGTLFGMAPCTATCTAMRL